MQFSIGISDNQGLSQLHPLRQGETLIGCDLAADICVSGEPLLLPGHILVSPRSEHCWVSTSSGAPLYDPSGQPIEAAFVPWGTRLRIGHTHFDLQVAKRAEGIDKPQKSRNSGPGSLDTGLESDARLGGVHPLLLMFLLSTIALVGFNLFAHGTSPEVSLPAEQVELFATPLACSSANAAHRAEQAEQAAIAKSERSVFYLQDGIAAVALFEEASACYQVAGLSTLAQQNLALGGKMRASLSYDYKTMRLRLERALADGQTQVAREQVRRLQELLHHQPESATSLALRRLALRLSRKH